MVEPSTQTSIEVLRDYYAEKDEAFVQTTHDKATGAASGIIGMLEVVESDFSKNLAEGSAAEAMAQEAYLPFLLRPPARLADGRFNPLLSKLAL